MTLWLLDHGADPNKQCSIDLTPLSYAVEQASPPTVKLLLDRGGDVHKGQLLHHAVDRIDCHPVGEADRFVGEAAAIKFQRLTSFAED